MKTGSRVVWGLPAIALVLLAAALAFVGWAGHVEQESTQASPGFSVGVDLNTGGNSSTSLGSIEASRVVHCGESFSVDVYVTEVTDLQVWNAAFQFDPAILGVYARDIQMFLAASSGSEVDDLSDGNQGGTYDLLASDIGDPPQNESGSGVLARLSVRALAPGVTKADVAPVIFYGSSGLMPTPPAVNAQITVVGQCGTPVPTPTPEPTHTATPTPTAPTGTASPTPTPSTATPTATPMATPTPPPPAGTITLVAGWNASCYGGITQPIEDALGSVKDRVLAVYRMRQDQGFDRWFPGRPDLSSVSTLNPWDQLLVLTSQSAVWEHQAEDSVPESASLVNGWNSVCYLGEANDPGDATTAIAGKFDVLYTLLADQSWRRYVPGRPEVTNLPILYPRTAVLVLVTATDGALWVFNP